MRFLPNLERTDGMNSGHFDFIKAFPLGTVQLGFPEAIGDVDLTAWVYRGIKVTWDQLPDGTWRCKGDQPGELTYSYEIRCAADYADVVYTITNKSNRTWKQSFAFNCVNGSATDRIRDLEAARHWVRTAKGEFKRLVEVPRAIGPRPTIQFYSVVGQPRAESLRFVDNFKATHKDVTLEGWLAIQSTDGKALLATVSKPALFLFQNMEYSCIHSALAFGHLEPGQSASGVTRVYIVEATVEDWYHRMQREFLQDEG